MVRRVPYSNVSKSNQIRAEHVKGMGDVVFKGFQCLNPRCTNFMFVKVSDMNDDFEFVCEDCGFVHESGAETKFYEYSMNIKDINGNHNSVATGDFTIYHEDYINEAQEYKYCIVCNSIKPLVFFDNHASRKSGRQGECRLCKTAYNDIKNGTRLSDQHREAAQKRRLLLEIAGTPKINSKIIENRYNEKCFACGKDLSNCVNKKEKPLDHTLPVYYLWPLSTENATLLCRTCNGQKSGTWPSKFYNDSKLRELSVLTGIDYSILSGPPIFNPQAILLLHNPIIVSKFLAKNIAYFDEIARLRNRIYKLTAFDFFSVTTKLSKTHIEYANKLLT